MPIELKMPALSPTMEEGTLAKWLVKEGDTVKSGDLLAEIETDKATMEYEAIDDGVISQIVVPEGTDNVKVGTVIAVIAGEGEDAGSAKASPTPASAPAAEAKAEPAPAPAPVAAAPVPAASTPVASGDRIKASPLAKRLAAERGIDLSTQSRPPQLRRPQPPARFPISASRTTMKSCRACARRLRAA